MHWIRRHLWWLLVAVGPLANVAGAESTARYVAVFASGRRLEGAALTDWHAGGATSAPKLDNQALLDPAQPLRWLRDRSVGLATPATAYIELSTGDKLPGTVLTYDDGSRTPYDPRGPTFSVRPDVALSPPVAVADPRVTILAAYVRRIVWQRRAGAALAAGTAAFRDGRLQSFRAARFSTDSVSLLTDEGPRRAHFGDLAEICLPAPPSWDSLLDELAALAPTGQGRILQIETTDGLIATASLDRLRCHAAGAPPDSSRWIHAVQPVWSAEALWVPHPRIAIRRLWAPDEMPLSRVTPQAVRHKSLLGASTASLRVNRNILDGPLNAGGADFGWGFGVQALSQLEFPLPAVASAFRAQVGLDRTAGSGGCVRARVYVAAADQPPAYDSGFLVGNAVTSETGVIPLNPAAGSPSRLLLEIDPAHDGRPAGADPLDIRDLADWLDPLVFLDAARLQAELAQRSRRQLAAWAGWTPWTDETTVTPEQRGALQWLTTWNDLAVSPGNFQVGVAAVNRPLVLSRQVKVATRDSWLIAAASQAVATNPPIKIEIRIQGDLVAEQTLVVRNAGQRDPPPLAVPVTAYRGQTIDIDVVQHPSPPPAPAAPPHVVHWRALGVFPNLPTLLTVLDEDVSTDSLLGAGQQAADVVAGDAASGLRSVQLQSPAEVRLELPEVAAIRDVPAWGEYRYLRMAVRSAGEGQFGVRLETTEPREKPAALDGGVGPAVVDGAVRIYQAKLPEQWIVLPHDLVATFGRFDLNGLSLLAAQGRHLRFDAVYLGRTLADFEWIGREREPVLPAQAVQDALVAAAQAKARQALVELQFADGRRGLGVLLTADGDVLTLASLVTRPQQPVKVQLADGRTATGQTRGMARDLDLALVKLAEPGPWPFVELDATPALPADRPYAAARLDLAGNEAGKPREVTLTATMVRRVARNSIWIAADVPALDAGAPLWDAAGRVVGLASRQHGGRWLFGRTAELVPLLPRLRASEVVGSWPTRLAPSAAIPLQAGERPVRLDGRPISGPRDLLHILADHDPDQEVAVDLVPARSLRITLGRPGSEK